jgi:hypothetical protein
LRRGQRRSQFKSLAACEDDLVLASKSTRSVLFRFQLTCPKAAERLGDVARTVSHFHRLVRSDKNQLTSVRHYPWGRWRHIRSEVRKHWGAFSKISPHFKKGGGHIDWPRQPARAWSGRWKRWSGGRTTSKRSLIKAGRSHIRICD